MACGERRDARLGDRRTVHLRSTVIGAAARAADAALGRAGRQQPRAARIDLAVSRSFTVTGATGYHALTLRLLRDDGAVVYLNGTEVFRTNMPMGAIGARTLAPVATPDENTFFEAALDPALLLEGTNVVAIEVHQSWPTSSDISFDAELTGTWTAASATASTRLRAGAG